MSQDEMMKWRRLYPEFSEIYDNLPIGQKGLFVIIYRDIFNNWNGPGQPFSSHQKAVSLKVIHKDGQEKKVPEIELQSWLDAGWERGFNPDVDRRKKHRKLRRN